MADQPLHSIRLKRGDVEFELTGSRDDVARAWEALRPSVTTAFDAPATARRSESGDGAGTERKRRIKRSTGGTAKGPKRGSRTEIVEALDNASVEDFPEIGDDPSALYAGMATLSWARESVGVDGLRISEIHTFLSKRFRVPHIDNAYREAFRKQPRAVQGNGSPKVFRLMGPGDKALELYLKKLATGATTAEAQAEAAPEAEGK